MDPDQKKKKNYTSYDIISIKISNVNQSIITETRSLFAWVWRLEQEGRIRKAQEKTFGSSEHVYYLNFGDDFMGIYKCQNLSKFRGCLSGSVG